MDEEICWKASPICCLRSYIWFEVFLTRWRVFDLDVFFSTRNCALWEQLMGECMSDPGFEVVVIAREDGSNEDAWGVEVSSSSVGWSGLLMSSGWGELGLTRAMVEISDLLSWKGISNSPVSSSLFTTLRYSRDRVTKGALLCYPPVLFFSVNKRLKNFLVSFHLSNGLRWENNSLGGRRTRQTERWWRRGTR